MKEYAKRTGHEEGLAEGRAEGRAEGEKAKAIEMAKAMLNDKANVELIVKYTGLTLDEVLKLK